MNDNGYRCDLNDFQQFMKKALSSVVVAATLFFSFVVSGCDSKVNNAPTNEIHEEHDHHGHSH